MWQSSGFSLDVSVKLFSADRAYRVADQNMLFVWFLR